MKFWHNWRDDVIVLLRRQVDWLQHEHQLDRERIDRLTEALATKAGMSLVLPMPPPPTVEKVYTPNPWKDPNLVTGMFPVQQQEKTK